MQRVPQCRALVAKQLRDGFEPADDGTTERKTITPELDASITSLAKILGDELATSLNDAADDDPLLRRALRLDQLNGWDDLQIAEEPEPRRKKSGKRPPKPKTALVRPKTEMEERQEWLLSVASVALLALAPDGSKVTTVMTRSGLDHPTAVKALTTLENLGVAEQLGPFRRELWHLKHDALDAGKNIV